MFTFRGALGPTQEKKDLELTILENEGIRVERYEKLKERVPSPLAIN